LDLSFPPFTPDHELHAWPAELAVLLVGLAARQGGSPTAAVQAGLALPVAVAAVGWLAPTDGSFNGEVAAALQRWRRE